MQLRTLFLFLLLYFCQQQTNAQNTPYKRYQGLLWEISGKGTTRPSYLYGTMHVPEKLVYNLSDSFFVALRSCEYVSLETDHNVWQEFMQTMKEDVENMGYGGMGSMGNYNNYQDLYGQSFRYAAPDINLLGAMFAYKPVMANEFLYRSNGYGEDFEEDTYLDLFIFQAGKKLGKKVIGLESMEDSYEMVTRAQIPDDDADQDYNPYDRRYVSPNGLRDAYRKQDLNTLDSLNTIMSPGKNFKKWMLDERNIIMANGIDSIARMGTNMFSAVGAAHLPGEMGVIELLRKKGYTVRPVQFSFDTDKKDMNEIEKMHYPVNFSRQWSNDSTWSAEAPGKFYTTSEAWNIEQSLCADMSNGAYYAAYRLKTNGLWTGQSPEHIAMRLDSIIYEKIPGKIQERKRFTEPFPGHEIITRTRRGDIQRYKLYITPAEVVLFIMGGNGDYVSGDEGTRFFNSIQVVSKGQSKEAQGLVAPAMGNIQVTFPTPPFINTTTDKKATELYIAAQEPNPDNGYYFLTRVSYHDYYYIEEDTFELNIIAEKIAEQFTKSKPEMSALSLNPYPTQRFKFKSDRDSAWYFGKIIIDGPQYYLLGSRNKTGKSPDAFLNSFSLKTSDWSDGWMEKTDTLGLFKVTTLKKEEKKPSQLSINLKKITEEITKKQTARYDDGGFSYRDRYYTTDLTSPATGENINISSAYITPSSYPDKDSLIRMEENAATRSKQFAVQSFKMEERGDTMFVFEYILKDTNSNRGVLNKVIHTHQRRYDLSASINLDVPPSAFITKVFESFTPTDSSVNKPIVFGGRDISFLDYIYNADSTLRKKAITQMREYRWRNFEKGDYSRLASLIKSPDFYKLKFVDREYLLAAIGSCKSDRSLAFLREFYLANSDSVRMQSVAIKNMARIHTRESYKTMFELLLKGNGYLDGSHQSVLYTNMKEDLNLTRHFVPELIQLAQINDHFSPVINLLSKLADAKLIKPKAYKSLKAPLLAEQYHRLKQTRYQEEQKRDKNNFNPYDRYGSGGYYGGTPGLANAGNTHLELLMGFYHTDPRVHALFDEMLSKGNNEMQLSAIKAFAKYNVAIPESNIRQLAASDETRFPAFAALVNSGNLQPYTSVFQDTLALVRSYLLAGNKAEDIDSVRFISKFKSVVNKKPAMMYFLDVKRKKSPDWMLYYVTLPLDFGLNGPASDKQKALTNPLLHDNDYGYDVYGYENDEYSRYRYPVQVENNLSTEKDKQTFIAKKTGEIRFAGRARYRSEQAGGYYDEY